jgi:uncharacterized protein (DUF58 family)
LPGLLLAQATSDNAPEGAYFTLWFPLGLFIIVVAILWVLYARPHRRVPARPVAPARAGGGAPSAGDATAAVQAGSPGSGAAVSSAGTAEATSPGTGYSAAKSAQETPGAYSPPLRDQQAEQSKPERSDEEGAGGGR